MAIKKVLKKMVAVIALAGILAGAPSSLYAAAFAMQGVPILATPYDQRLNDAGAWMAFAPVQNFRSAEDLFQQARHFRYETDGPGRDHWQTPEETESRWAGDCEDKAVWLYTQLKRNGYQNVKLVIGREKASSKGLHVWIVLEHPAGTFNILDPTNQNRIWSASDFSSGQYRPLYSFDGTHRYRHDA